MNITQENFLLNRKAFYLKELSELKDKEIEILENINTLDSILSTYEDEPEPISEKEIPFTTKFLSVDERTIEVSISEEKEGEDKDKFYDQIIEIVKCLLDLIKPPIVESFFVEQETEKCTESFLTGLAESMFSGDPFKEETTVTNSNTTYFSDYIIGLYPIEKESDESPRNLYGLKL